jgi:type VI secretion system protein ImpL
VQSPVPGTPAADTLLQHRWRNEVWEPYRRMVGKYPFVSTSPYEVSMEEFAEFFRPRTGLLWAFYDELLAQRLLRSGTRFTHRPSEQRSDFRGDFLACLSSAQTITDAMFPGDASKPSVPFGVKIQAVNVNVSDITLRVDGQALVYRNEPERWQSLEWPGRYVPGAAIKIHGLKGTDEIHRRGEFAFIRLLEDGRVRPVAPGSVDLEATWSLHGGSTRVTVQFRPPASRNPFARGFFSNFQCPPEIISGDGSKDEPRGAPIAEVGSPKPTSTSSKKTFAHETSEPRRRPSAHPPNAGSRPKRRD